MKGTKATYKREYLVVCVDDTPNYGIGPVNNWVKKGEKYWAKNPMNGMLYGGSIVFDLFDNNHKQVVPNKECQQWISDRFASIMEIALN